MTTFGPVERQLAPALRTVVVAAAAAAVGWSAVERPAVAALLVGVPVLAGLFTRPAWALVAAAALLPLQRSLTQGNGLQVSPADVLLAVTAAAVASLVLAQPVWRARLADTRPALLWIAPYFGWLVVVLTAHPSLSSALNTLQYAELTAVAMVLGAVVLDRRTARWATLGFVAVASLTAVAWIAGRGSSITDNKNPAGQFMVDAALLALVVVPRWRHRVPVILLLAVGSLYSQSRGAVIGAAVGALVLLAARGFGSWKATAGAVLPLAALCVIGYTLVPASVAARVAGTFTSADIPTSIAASNHIDGNLTPAQYSVHLREIYRREGLVYVRAHELDGVGVGNYATGDPTDGTFTNEPHDVLLRNAGEGGLPDLGLFVVMVLGTGLVVLRRRSRSPWVPAALAVQAAILTHGVVDVYWVRGTPVIGWLLVGMALNRRLDRSIEPAPA